MTFRSIAKDSFEQEEIQHTSNERIEKLEKLQHIHEAILAQE